MLNPETHSPRRLRVFHVLTNREIGGITRMLSVLIPRADAARFDMRAVNMHDRSEAYPLWDRRGVRYHRLPAPGKFLLGSVPGLARFLRREKPDVIEVYGLRASIIARLAAAIAGVPVVLTGVISTDDWRRRHHIWLDRLTRWGVTRWVANSHACKRSLVEREKHPAERIDVIYDAIDVAHWTRRGDGTLRPALRRQWGWDDDSIVYVTVANLRPLKGVQFLIEAVPMVLAAQPRARFLLVGTDEMGGQLQHRCASLGIQDAVAFAGFQDNVRDIYEASDVAVLPSLHEGLPICLIEAMSMELPVVATAVSGTPELVDEGRTGLLVPPGDVKALGNALIRVSADPVHQERMGQAGRKCVCETFGIERMVQELEEYYERQVRSATNGK